MADWTLTDADMGVGGVAAGTASGKAAVFLLLAVSGEGSSGGSTFQKEAILSFWDEM